MIVVLVVNREFAKFLALKFTSATGTDPGENLERLFPIPLQPLLPAAAGLSDNPVHFFGVYRFFL